MQLNRLDMRVSVLENALADYVGEAHISIPDNNRGGSAIASGGSGTPVSVICLDSTIPLLKALMVAENRPRVINLLKIDVESFEPRVLRGASEFFETFRVLAIILEISSWGWQRNGCRASELVAVLFAKGYLMQDRQGRSVTDLSAFNSWAQEINLDSTLIDVVFRLR